MKTKFLDHEQAYDGSQLRSLWNYLEHGLMGDSTIAFVGPCDVSVDHMVDGEDLRANDQIRGDKMLHFICEIFHQSLFSAVALQRLFASMVRDEWVKSVENTRNHSLPAAELRRSGDDLYAGDRKFSISIATQSPVSVLIHFAVNITNQGTPVETCSLEDWSIDPQVFGETILKRWSKEYASLLEATVKVRWVK